ncbi:MAG: two-component regulator propeller domain-containing protein, partial [Bacteroidota bacterium]
MESNQYSILFSLLLLFSSLTLGHGQDELAALPLLTPSYSQSFDHFKTFPSMCFKKAFWDAKGRLWLKSCGSATQHRVHLFQFDGYEFRVVRAGLEELGIRANFSLIHKERFLIGIDDYNRERSIISYDLFTNQLEIFPLTLPAEQVRIIVDENERLLLLVLKDSLLEVYLWDRGQMEEVAVHVTKGLIDYNLPVDILANFDANGGWLLNEQTGTFTLLDLLSETSKQYSVGQFLPAASRWSISNVTISKRFCKKLSNGISYFKMMYGDRQYFVRFDEQSAEVTMPKNIPKTWIPQDVFEDQQGNHLLYYKEESGKAQVILEEQDGKQYNYSAFFQGEAVAGALEVYSPNFRDQILICNRKGFMLHRVQLSEAIQNVLPGVSIRAMVEIEKDKILVTSQNRFYSQFILDLKTHQVQAFEQERLTDPKSRLGFKRLMLDAEGFLWGTSGNGLVKYHPLTKSLKCYPLVPSGSNHGFRSFAFIDERRVVGIQATGFLYLLDLETGVSQSIDHNGTPYEVDGHVHQMIYGKRGHLWLATSNGLHKINPFTGAHEIIGLEAPFKDTRFMSMEQDESGRLWLGTPLDGLYIYDPVTEEVKIIDSSKGLPNNTIASILTDDDGDRWIGTYNGISIVSAEGELLDNLYVEDGLADREC